MLSDLPYFVMSVGTMFGVECAHLYYVATGDKRIVLGDEGMAMARAYWESVKSYIERGEHVESK